jgi:oligopeptidase B
MTPNATGSVTPTTKATLQHPAATLPGVQPPIAKRIDHVWNRPSGSVTDPWAWLRNRDDADTIAYLEAENGWSDAWFAEQQPLVDELFDEIRSRVQETDLWAPVRKDHWWYVSRTEEGASYQIHCRGHHAHDATAQVILDENEEAAGHEYFSLNAFDVNPQHTVLAWSSDIDGSEEYTMHFRDLLTGHDLPDELENTTWGGTAWSADGTMLFYVTADEQQRPYCVWRHRLGTTQADDVKVYEETDERFFVYVDLCRSGDWILIDSASRTSAEIRVIPAGLPETPAALVRQREDDHEYMLDHWGDRWVVLTNLDATDFRVATAPIDRPADWTEFVPHVQGRRILTLEAFAGHLVLHEWSDAQPRLRVLFRDGTERVVDALDEPHDVELENNPEWNASTVRYLAQSLTTPASLFEEDVRTGTRTLLKQTPVPGTDLGRYTTQRVWATAADGARVPIDVVRHRDTPVDSSAMLCVYGYGSYESSIPPYFSVARLSLLDRGGVWALVHPRGGGELGRTWYLDGKLDHKRNTFTDTIAAVEHLVAEGFGSPGRVAVRGGSAGGLLVGACITMRPDLFRAAVAEVPFVDVVSTMSDPTLPLTVTEWEEWGDPRDEPMASYMLSYSPYDNTVPADYPAILITAGLNDPRVSFHEPAKWIARLRAVRTNDATLLLRCEMGAGHGGPSGRYETWRDEARMLSFILRELS